jgi:hypothetical protein
LLNEAEETSNKELDAAIEQLRTKGRKKLSAKGHDNLSAKDMAEIAGAIEIPGAGLAKKVLGIKSFFTGDDEPELEEEEIEDDDTELDEKIEELTDRSKEKLIVRKQSIISNFLIPTSKDEVIEFLSNATPYAKKQGNFFSGEKYEAHNELVPIWKLKREQIMNMPNK